MVRLDSRHWGKQVSLTIHGRVPVQGGASLTPQLFSFDEALTTDVGSFEGEATPGSPLSAFSVEEDMKPDIDGSLGNGEIW